MRPAVVPLSGGHDETILVVEDNDLLRASLVRQLTLLGYQVLDAADAGTALTVLETHPVQLLFTDVVMPGALDGIALAREVLGRWPNTRIVMTSGFTDRKVNGDGVELTPFVRFVQKPFRRDELAYVIRDILDC